MRKSLFGKYAVVLSIAITLFTAGCGGGGGGNAGTGPVTSSDSSSSSATTVTPTATPVQAASVPVTLQYQAAGKTASAGSEGLPAATVRVVIHLINPSTNEDVVPPVESNHQPGALEETVTIPNVPYGTWVVLVRALDNSNNGLGYFHSTVGVSGTAATITVNASVTLTSLAISPATATVSVGASTLLTSTGTFSDGSTETVNHLGTWSSSDTGVASVDYGKVAGLQAGQSTVTVVLDGKNATAAVTVAASTTPTPTPTPTPAPGSELSYVGSAKCNECHSSIYETFMKSGHPYKVSKVINNTMPTFPFSSIQNFMAKLADSGGTGDPNGTQTDNTLGTPLSYADVSYVIGGYGWKARFIDKNGYIVTGSSVQYNLADNSMSAYNNNTVDKKFDCGECHTTGWKHYDATLNNARQDNLPGMDGTFEATGVQCESCHGAGSKHASSAKKEDIVRKATPRTTAQLAASDMAHGAAVACAECHTRDGEKLYPTYVSAGFKATGLTEGGRIVASGGLINHHETYDEIVAVNPDSAASGSTRTDKNSAMWDCNTCHDPHKSTRYGLGGARKSNADCLQCHTIKTPEFYATQKMANLNCIDCHMPKMVKSAINTTPGMGDIRAHIFRIDLTKSPTSKQYTADGKYAYPWVTYKYACNSCHGVTELSLDPAMFATYRFHKW